MLSYLIRRLFFVIFVVWGVTFATFFIAQVVPADPALAALGDNAREDQIQAFREKNGLNKPAAVQYAVYMNKLLHGDLGQSLRTSRPVMDDLKEFFPATIELSFTAFFISMLIGIPAGVVAALTQNRLPDSLVRILALLAGSMPVFFLGILALEIFHRQWGLFPGPGRLDPYLLTPPRVTGFMTIDSLLAKDFKAFIDSIYHMILPALVLGSASAALLARMTRGAMLEVFSQDYIRTARAKGNTPRAVVQNHAAKNAALPILTVLGGLLGGLLSGAVLTETIFSWPGIGRYVTTSASSLDFPAVMGVTLLAGLIYAFINLLIDLLYALIDPRIRYA